MLCWLVQRRGADRRRRAERRPPPRDVRPRRRRRPAPRRSASTRSPRSGSPTSSTRPERRALLTAALGDLPADGSRRVGGRGVAPRRSRARLALVRALAPRRRARRRVAVSPAYWATTLDRAAAVAISRPEPRRRLKLPRNLPRRRQTAAVLARRRAVLPQPRLLRPDRRARGRRRAPALSLLLLRAWSIQVLHGQAVRGARAHPGVPDGRPARRARRDRRRARAGSLAGTTGHVVDRRRRRLARQPRRARRWQPEPSRRCARSARLVAPHRHAPGATLVARIRQLGAPARRSRPPSCIPHPNAALAAYMQERARALPRLQGRGRGRRGAIRRARSAASSSACSARSAGRAQVAARYKHAQRRRGRRPERRRGRVRLAPQRAASCRRRSRSTRMGRIAGALRVPRQKQPPTLQLSIDTRLQQAAREGARSTGSSRRAR